jgi:hypothetical protein
MAEKPRASAIICLRHLGEVNSPKSLETCQPLDRGIVAGLPYVFIRTTASQKLLLASVAAYFVDFSLLLRE